MNLSFRVLHVPDEVFGAKVGHFTQLHSKIYLQIRIWELREKKAYDLGRTNLGILREKKFELNSYPPPHIHPLHSPLTRNILLTSREGVSPQGNMSPEYKKAGLPKFKKLGVT